MFNYLLANLHIWTRKTEVRCKTDSSHLPKLFTFNITREKCVHGT